MPKTFSNEEDQEKESESSFSAQDLAEITQKGFVFSQIEELWKDVLGFPIEKIIKTREFKKEGIYRLISEVETNAPIGEKKETLLSYFAFILENNKKLISLLDPSSKNAVKIRHSGHFIDQKLKYESPKQSQLTLFDSLQSNALKTKIEKYEYSVTSVGVRLTPPEDKLLNALQKLLHKKSQNRMTENPDYYKGNMPVGLVHFGKEKAESPRLRIKPAELYKAYLDRDRYSGDEVKYIRDTIMNLSSKKFLLKFDRKRKVKKGNTIQTLTDRIEEFQSLIHVIKYTEGMSENELQKTNSGDSSIFDQKGELIIGFNPLLVDQINAKYVEYPSDINKRMILAAGGHRFVTEAMNLLRDYMLRELSSKRTHSEIYEDRLLHLLKFHKMLKNRQYKRASQKAEKAIQAIKNLGLILDTEIVDGAQGQKKYIFTLNASFQ